MKLSFFRKPVHYTPPQQESSLQDYRDQILSVLLTSATILGTLAYIVATVPSIKTHQYESIIVYTICYGWVLFIFLQRNRLSSAVKTNSLLALFYLLGVYNLIEIGLPSLASAFLLGFVAMSTLMAGGRSGILTLFISIATFALTGVMIHQGVITPPVSLNNLSTTDWISAGGVLLMLCAVLSLSVNAVLQGLNSSVAKIKTLVVDTDRDRAQLRRHSQDLQRRLAQLRTIADIEHSISTMLEPEELLQKVVDALSERFGLYFVGIFLFEDQGLSPNSSEREPAVRNDVTGSYFNRSSNELILQASSMITIPTGSRMSITGLQDSEWSGQDRKAHVTDTSGRKNEFVSNHLPMARTELGVPLVSRDRSTGMLMIYSTQTNAFDSDDISLFQSLGDSLATAFENARLFQQTQNDLNEIRSLQRQYLSRAWAEAQQVHPDLNYTYVATSEDQEAKVTENDELTTYSTQISFRDHKLGQIILETDRTCWNSEERYFIDSVINEAALALDNARLMDETLRRSHHDRLVAEITRSVRASTDIESILSIAIRELGRNLGASEAIITLDSSPGGEEQAKQGGMLS